MENQSDNKGTRGFAVITGGSRGIGYAIAREFAEAGYNILISGRNVMNLEEAVITISTAYPGLVVKCFPADLSVKKDVVAFAEWCLAQGSPVILVNNAGNYLPGNAWDEPDGQMERMMNTNFYSAYYLTRLLLPGMISQGRGHIFNICSVASLEAYEGGGSYSISKFALDGLSKNLRHELRKTGIKVTAVYPGAVMTDTWGDFDNSAKRIMEAEDVARMVIAASALSATAVVEDIVLRPQLGDL
jgi:short-subunit dehydrogenase